MKKLPCFGAVAGLCAAAFVAVPRAARAQTTLPAPVAPAAAAPAAANGNSRPVEAVLNDLSRATQITVIADSSVAPQVIFAPAETVTPDTLEAALTNITRRLARGTQWVKLMLPELPNKRVYKGDDVADYALAQARLFGNVGAPPPAGKVEIMGQKVSAAEAAPVVAALNLKPVYVIINPSARASGAGTPTGNWGKMTPDQQKNYAAQQAQAIKNMSPAQRTEMMQQQGAVMSEYFQGMSPDERRQMFQQMRGANENGSGWGGNRGGGGRGN